MHVSSLYGDYSIGTLGKEAFEFIDFLSECGFGIWQVLPLCMTDSFNSPYSSKSSFGFNPYFIDLPTLFSKGFITEEELNSAKSSEKYLVEFERLRSERLPLLFKAAKRAGRDLKTREEMSRFFAERPYLAAAARFLSIKDKNGGAPWQEWQNKEIDEECLFAWQFIQYEFFCQWSKIKKHAEKKGVKIVGDMPIYVSLDSADVWSEPENFLLDSKGYPLSVSGVPPDYFSPDGQLWNNPIYDYKRMEENGFLWWKTRIKHMLSLFDGIRIDHFRGFDAYWSVPSGAKSAREGKWIEGPSRKIIDAIRSETKDALIIAEDLGDITDSVRELLSYSKFSGMRVFQFAFLGDYLSPHLPHNYINECVAYTGTHDNNTLLGYLYECDAATRVKIFEYCGYRGSSIDEGARQVMSVMLRSSAGAVIFPIQDILGFGADTRMNTPGVAKGNWAYRVTAEQLSSLNREKYSKALSLFGRL